MAPTIEPVGDVEFSISVKRISDFVESSFAENYTCSIYDEDSVWGVLLAECHVANTLKARRACYMSYVSYVQQETSITERCYPFAPPTSQYNKAVTQPIQDLEMSHPIPPKCGCRYVPSGIIKEKCNSIGGGHTHCPKCRLVVPYSLSHWHNHVIDVCGIPKEDYLIFSTMNSFNHRLKSVFDFSHPSGVGNSGTAQSQSQTSNPSNANNSTATTQPAFKIQICFICTKMFRLGVGAESGGGGSINNISANIGVNSNEDEKERLKRHYLLNHAIEYNQFNKFNFKVAHQIDPIRGLYAIIDYASYAIQVNYFVKQYNSIKCYACSASSSSSRSNSASSVCPHYVTVLQNCYPVEEYRIADDDGDFNNTDSVLSQLPLSDVNKLKKFEMLANKNVVPSIVALKTPPHIEASIFSVMDENNLLKRFTVVVLANKKKIVCSCSSASSSSTFESKGDGAPSTDYPISSVTRSAALSSSYSAEIENNTYGSASCWHQFLVCLALNDQNTSAKCCFNLTEVKTFLNNSNYGSMVEQSMMIASLSVNSSSCPAPIEDASKLVILRLNHEIEMLQNEVNLLRETRKQYYGEYLPSVEDKENKELEETANANSDYVANHPEQPQLSSQIENENDFASVQQGQLASDEQCLNNGENNDVILDSGNSNAGTRMEHQSEQETVAPVSQSSVDEESGLKQDETGPVIEYLDDEDTVVTEVTVSTTPQKEEDANNDDAVNNESSNVAEIIHTATTADSQIVHQSDLDSKKTSGITNDVKPVRKSKRTANVLSPSFSIYEPSAKKV